MSSIARDDQPAAKKQKTYDADDPVEDDKTAREKLRAAGFDPDDVHTARTDAKCPKAYFSWYNITPMTYFACLGDLPMCRYLYHVRGASTLAPGVEHLTYRQRSMSPLISDDESEEMNPVFWFPLYVAVHQNHFDTAKWLFHHKAAPDLRRLNEVDRTPFSLCFEVPFDRIKLDIAKWFIMNGAMDSKKVSVKRGLIKYSLHGVTHDDRWDGERGLKSFVVDWCDDLILTNSSVRTFLLGTLPKPEYSVESLKQLCAKKLGSIDAATLIVGNAVAMGNCRDLWEELLETFPTNSCLASFPGISETIAEYAGFIKGSTEIRRLKAFRWIVSTSTERNIEGPRSSWSDSDY